MTPAEEVIVKTYARFVRAYGMQTVRYVEVARRCGVSEERVREIDSRYIGNGHARAVGLIV